MPVFGAIGVALGASVATSFSAIAIGVVATAVVGAAIGGLSAAVMGGDIGKGMLFGAIGGVATAGILSGVGAMTGTMGGGTFGIGQGAMNVGAAGADGLAVSGYGQGLATTATTAAKSSLFGGGGIGGLFTGEGGIAGALGGKLIDLGAGLFKPKPQENWGITEEGIRFNAGENRALKALGGGGGSGGGSGGAEMPWPSTEAGHRFTLAEQYKQAELKESGAMSRLSTEYKLQAANASDAYKQQTAKFGESADVSGTQKYEGASEEARAAIRARQGGGALTGPEALKDMDEGAR